MRRESTQGAATQTNWDGIMQCGVNSVSLYTDPNRNLKLKVPEKAHVCAICKSAIIFLSGVR
jgi:hypothetical protein